MTKAVMTIHGYITGTGDFDRLYGYLNFYDEVCRFSVPGHDSKDFKYFTVEATITSLIDTFDKLKKKYDEVDVIGFSMGGALASYLAVKRDINKLVLLAPANKYLNVLQSISKYNKMYYKVFDKAFKDSDGTIIDKLGEALKAVEPYRTEHDETSMAWLKTIAPYITPQTFKTFSSLVSECDTAIDLHGKVDTPTLIIRGELDELVPMSSVEYLQKMFTKCKFKSFNDIGHNMLRSKDDGQIIEEIVSFLTGTKQVLNVPKRDKPNIDFLGKENK